MSATRTPLPMAVTRTPGTPYAGRCPNCHQQIKAAIYFDRDATLAPYAIEAGCECRAVVQLDRVPGRVWAMT